MILLTWLVAFICAIAVDYSYARWVIALAKRRRTSAAFFSALCTVLGVVSIIVCVNDYTAIIFTAMGHALGTWIAVTYDSK